MQKEIASSKREKGYRIIAVDGTEGELPNTPELMKKYKANEKSRYPQFSAVVLLRSEDLIAHCMISLKRGEI